jgi:hypothetical protein
MAITFLLRLFKIRFSLMAAGKCHKIAPFIRVPLKIFCCPSLLLGVSILPGVLTFSPLSAFSQNAEVGPTSAATESPPALSDEIDRPSRDVQVETNANPVNENFRRFRYNFGVTVRDVYDDNINLSSTNRVGDWYFVVEPAIHLGFGDSEGGFNYVAFDYILSAYFFADQTERNGVEHIIHLAAQHDFGHVVLGLSQDVQILDGTSLNSLSSRTGAQANTDVNGPSRSNTYTTAVNASYDLTGKLFLSGQASYARTDYDVLVSSQIVSGNIYINYVYSPKLVIGLGTTGGVTTNDGPTGDETFEQINARANYIVSGKISLSISAGIEFRQFDDGDSVSPVYDISGSYRPFENTIITIAGSGHTRNSASLAGQDFEETSISLTLSQRLFSRATFSLAEGYTHSAYLNASTGQSTARTDDYFYIEPAFDINVTRYWSVGVYYLYRTDLSTLAFFSFHDNQFGIRSSLIF